MSKRISNLVRWAARPAIEGLERKVETMNAQLTAQVQQLQDTATATLKAVQDASGRVADVQKSLNDALAAAQAAASGAANGDTIDADTLAGIVSNLQAAQASAAALDPANAAPADPSQSPPGAS